MRANALAARKKSNASTRRAARRQPPNPWENVGAQGANLGVGHFLTFQVIRLANALKANVTRRYLSDFHLSVPEWRLLGMTINFEPVRFSELVANSSMDKGQVSRTLQMLVKRGIVAARAAGRAARHPAEGSAPVILTVTPKGRRLYRTVLPVSQRNQARLLRMLSREERKSLYTTLNKLFDAIGDRDKLP
jgi:DNA-binding MarR family transcriptional regulator